MTNLTYEVYHFNAHLGSVDFLTSTDNVITFSFDFGFKGGRSAADVISGGGEQGGV
jgi:hypothetical protein